MKKYWVYFILFLSMFALFAAFVLQIMVPLEPCKLCIWQRWPHVINIFICMVILTSLSTNFKIFFVATTNMFVGSLLAFYHLGLEQNIWSNVFSCSGMPDLNNVSTEDLLRTLSQSPISACEFPAFSIFQISLTGWNLLISILISILWGWLIFLNKNNYATNSASQYK